MSLLTDELLEGLLRGRVTTVRDAVNRHPLWIFNAVLLMPNDGGGQPGCIVSALLPRAPHCYILPIHLLHAAHPDLQLQYHMFSSGAPTGVTLRLGYVPTAVDPRAQRAPRRGPEPPCDDGSSAVTVGAMLHGVALSAPWCLARFQDNLLLNHSLPTGELHQLRWHGSANGHTVDTNL